LLGRVPSTVTFTASATDPDGTVELYEWDFDGDGSYDWNSTENGNTEYEYTAGNNYTVELKVSDDQGLANRLFYKIAVLDFGIGAESHSDMVVLEWGWGEYQTILIPPGALSFLDDGDEVHIVDEAGIITDGCPIDESIDIGPISVSHQIYSSTSELPYVFVCLSSIDLCDYNGTVSPGYVIGNPIHFKILDISEGVYYDIIPETVESGSTVFGEAEITIISSFTTPSSKISGSGKTNQNNFIFDQQDDMITFNIYRNGQLLESNLTDKYYLDFDISPNTEYIYEIFLVDENGNEVISKSDSVTTGTLTSKWRDFVIPKDYSLSQNFPNPFNPTTTISYQLPKSSFVKLTIYDISGRLVDKIIDEKKNAGYYTVEWNAENVCSGVYFYRIEAGNFVAVKKSLLVK